MALHAKCSGKTHKLEPEPKEKSQSFTRGPSCVTGQAQALASYTRLKGRERAGYRLEQPGVFLERTVP